MSVNICAAVRFVDSLVALGQVYVTFRLSVKQGTPVVLPLAIHGGTHHSSRHLRVTVTGVVHLVPNFLRVLIEVGHFSRFCVVALFTKGGMLVESVDGLLESRTCLKLAGLA